MSPQALLAIQRTVGNAAVTRLLDEQWDAAHPAGRSSTEHDHQHDAAIQRAPAPGTRKRAGTTSGDPGPAPQRARTEAEQDNGDDSSGSELEVVIPTGVPTAPRRYRRQVGRGSRSPADQPLVNRRSELRMLDRVARILYQGLVNEDTRIGAAGHNQATPHLAVTLTNGQLRVSGNTDRPFTAGHQQQAERLLHEAMDDTGRPTMPTRRNNRDARKLRALRAGEYTPDQRDEQWMREFTAALGRGIHWDIQVTGSPARTENVHGEMILLGQTIEGWRQRAQARGPQPPGADPTPVYLGGYRRPCRACQWVINSVNEIIGPRYGFQVIPMTSHGNFYSHWNAPAWLHSGGDALIRQVLASVEEQARNNGTPLVNGRPAGPNAGDNSQLAPESDSEYEEA